MEIIPGLEAVPHNLGETVVTIGMFDGVHLGHRRIIDMAHREARELGLRCVVFTFDRHPIETLNPGKHPRLLSSSAQKLRLLEEMDVDLVLMVHFDRSFADITAERFVSEILAEKLHAREVVLGENFRFGRGGEGDISLLVSLGAHYGMGVTPVPLLTVDGEVVSSTSIRRLVEEGKVEEAARRLGWDYLVEGVVVRGDGRGRELGFPTANVEVHDDRCIPANGVYAGEAHLEGTVMPAVSYIGRAPTFPHPESRRRIEVHIPGWEGGDLYQRYLGVSFRRRLRGEMTFESPEALREQITRDVREAMGE
ncbi:bifunctional riboflavin kinase/FAD synthetase [Candidatus Solincola tengchongensis]|uniref:bifunctional riboflavin kinase/FAD synthetase n=1 Tax=Candidatus Solincola tengchongensis TaxID=2900693 RepID=UPI00257FFDFA|nr:bifunctional riboflavin kinase/FAD synthetase [Candidatus Solincola tengchongensis]